MTNPSPESAPGVPGTRRKLQRQETRKREVGQRARGARGEEDKEEKDAGMEEETAAGDDGNTERREDAGKSILDDGKEEPNNERFLGSRGDTTEGQGGPERQQLCHVPGGAWLQRVRSCLKNRISDIVGREEGGECEQREVGKGYLGKKISEKGEH
ncbi:hypothetical protein NDU88_004757 [Pleurodeles waltl]|uniref:Uncharacterized protein n=1 Tax=Pleurodeles waltl TaxID=8319 RepID=A0AAV7WSV1_PLEWA|nr:hypothetical protein NDU88_004757 [Pleurodeles waltl]